MKGSCRAEKIDPGVFNKVVLAVAPDLPRPALSRLHNAHEIRRFRPGDLLISEGDTSRKILFLCSGTVRLCLSPAQQINEQRNSRKAIPFWELTAPAALGLSSILNGGVCCHTAIAQTEVEAASVPKKDLDAILHRFAGAGLSFSRMLAEELTSSYSHLARLRV